MRTQTINDAIRKVLSEANSPLAPQQVYEKIVQKGYYQFKSTNPMAVVSNQLRRHCVGNKQAEKREKLYKKDSANLFVLL